MLEGGEKKSLKSFPQKEIHEIRSYMKSPNPQKHIEKNIAEEEEEEEEEGEGEEDEEEPAPKNFGPF